ncbi:phenylacetate--CoA ligase family protein [Marinilabilia salmonicolor]|uniref:phenylacetate--CoA ligase family protein n=1 Tax=Marinilabilia salmonicolor TaxID=989 RepID=UPI00029A23BF|nr:phenylacetate--CoA ligase family protein [Marinilabilia salmonicolor]
MADFFQTLKLLGFPVEEAYEEYRSMMNQDDLLIWQEKKKHDLVDYHIRNNGFYRGISNGWDGCWKNLPILTKQDLQGNHLKKISDVGKEKYYTSQTSGSSGQPFVFVRDRLTHTLIWLNVANHYSKAGISLNDSQARFYGIPLSGVKFWKEKLKDFISHRKRFNVFNLNDQSLNEWVKVFKKHSFSYLYGYTNTLLFFARYLIQNNIVLKEKCPGLKSCIVTAEVCTKADKAILEAGFGIPVYNEYGASEVCVIGFGGGEKWLVSDELVYLEVVDEQGHLLPDGESGRLLCTLLHNKGTPIIRYEVGDNASIVHEGGRTYIKELRGRLSDLVVLPSGKKVPGLTFYYVVQGVINKLEGIQEYKVVGRGNKNFEIQIVSRNEITPQLRSALNKAVEKYLEAGLTVVVVRVPEIDRTGAGKFKNFEKI